MISPGDIVPRLDSEHELYVVVLSNAIHLAAATGRQRIAIEIPSDIGDVERKDPTQAKEWRMQTRWAFTEAIRAGFFVAEFCRTVRGQQGPGVYLLEKGRVEEYVPELRRRVEN